MSGQEPILEAIHSLKGMIEDSNRKMQETQAYFMSAFPEDDPTAHRKAHQDWIDEVKSRKAFWEKMRFELYRWGLFGFLGWAIYQLWNGLLKGPHS